jgi:hypothetical protein
MSFTAAIFIVCYIPHVFNTTFDIQHSDIVTEVNNFRSYRFFRVDGQLLCSQHSRSPENVGQV